MLKRYISLVFPIYFASRASLLAMDGNFNFGFYLRLVLFVLSLYWSLEEIKKENEYAFCT